MEEEVTNAFPALKGIIHSLPIKKVMGKKGENKGKEIEIPSIVLEFTYKNAHKSQLASFQIARNVPIADFKIGDLVIITYTIESIEWKDDYITRTRAIYMKHADVDYNDTRDLRPQRPRKEEVFVAPSPNDEPEENDNLPF